TRWRGRSGASSGSAPSRSRAPLRPTRSPTSTRSKGSGRMTPPPRTQPSPAGTTRREARRGSSHPGTPRGAEVEDRQVGGGDPGRRGGRLLLLGPTARDPGAAVPPGAAGEPVPGDHPRRAVGGPHADRLLRRAGAGQPGRAVPGVGVHQPGADPEGEALGGAVDRRHGRALRRRPGVRVLGAAPRPRVPARDLPGRPQRPAAVGLLLVRAPFPLRVRLFLPIPCVRIRRRRGRPHHLPTTRPWPTLGGAGSRGGGGGDHPPPRRAHPDPARRPALSDVRDHLLGDTPDPPQVTIEAFFRDLPFTPDRFQVEAAESIASGRSVVVTAPTGAGKTLVAEVAVHLALERGQRAF